jgi:hypothetical protein
MRARKTLVRAWQIRL